MRTCPAFPAFRPVEECSVCPYFLSLFSPRSDFVSQVLDGPTSITRCPAFQFPNISRNIDVSKCPDTPMKTPVNLPNTVGIS